MANVRAVLLLFSRNTGLMTQDEIRKAAFARMVEAERRRYEARHGRLGFNETSEARRRLEQRGEKVTAESIESEIEYRKETEL